MTGMVVVLIFHGAHSLLAELCLRRGDLPCFLRWSIAVATKIIAHLMMAMENCLRQGEAPGYRSATGGRQSRSPALGASHNVPQSVEKMPCCWERWQALALLSRVAGA